MSALAELAPSLLTTARGIIAAFGCLCIVVHAVIPCLTVVGEFVVYELPSEVAKWQLQWAQQRELRALEDRVAALKKRRARQRREDAERAHEDYQMQARRRQEAQRRKHIEAERPKRRAAARESEEAEEAERQTQTRVRDTARSSSTHAVAKEDAKPSSIPKPRLRLRSPNIMVDRRPVSAYVKASAGVTKPADRARRAASSKARVLSLGSIFDEGVDENAAPVPRMWAH